MLNCVVQDGELLSISPVQFGNSSPADTTSVTTSDLQHVTPGDSVTSSKAAAYMVTPGFGVVKGVVGLGHTSDVTPTSRAMPFSVTAAYDTGSTGGCTALHCPRCGDWVPAL